MTPADHRKAVELFEQIRPLSEAEQTAALNRACPDDPDLRAQVARLLAADRALDARSFIERRAIDDAARLVSSGAMKLPDPGTIIGNYRLGSRIGSGGMGVVYEARDERLHRRVAVKILPPPLAGESTDLVSRFQREARAASLLNHPNILTIFDAGVDQGRYFIATEFVEGKTLRTLASKGPLDWKALSDIAIQVCSALAAAHEGGIVHRDIKPENVMIRPDGIVKVLDFGLAKMERLDEHDATVSLAGKVVGTAAYMSPEQARGEELDARADLFSFGAVLYEMATGRRAFPGNTSAVIHDAILNRSPLPPSQVDPALPPQLDEIILKALEKDRDLRYQSAAELRADLKRLRRDTDSGSVRTPVSGSEPAPLALDSRKINRHAAPSAQSRKKRLWAAIAAIALVAAASAISWYARPRSRAVEMSEWPLTANFGALVLEAAISPDGNSLAYADRTGLYLKMIGGGETHALPSPPDARIFQIAWFPNNRDLLISAMPGQENHAKLWAVSVFGGAPRLVRDDVLEVSVSADSSQVAFTTSARDALWVMDAGGQQARKVLDAKPGMSFVAPVWYPGHQKLLYLASSPALEKRSLELLDLEHKQSLTLSSAAEMLVEFCVAPDGRVLAVGMPGALYEIRTDPGTGQAVGKPRRIRQWAGNSWFHPTLSADGKRLAFLKRVSEGAVFVAGLKDGGKRLDNIQKLSLSGNENNPHAWTPDSKAVVFESNRDNFYNIFKQRLDAQTPEPLVAGRVNAIAGRFSPDGKWLFYLTIERKLMRLPATGGAAQFVLGMPGLLNYYCTRLKENFCVVGSRQQNKLVLHRFDPTEEPPPGGLPPAHLQELAKIDFDPSDWGISPDGSTAAMVRPEGQQARIHLVSLNGVTPARDVFVNGWTNLYTLNWAQDGKGWYASSRALGSIGAFLYIDLTGKATVLNAPESFTPSWGIPSPDGRYLAFASSPGTANAWMIENF